MLWLIPILTIFIMVSVSATRSRGLKDDLPLIFTKLLAVCALSAAAIVVGSNQARIGIPDRSYALVQSGKEGPLVDGGMYYLWYRKNGNAIQGGETLRKACVKIFEADGDPRMVTYKTAYASKWNRKFLWMVGLDLRDDLGWCPAFYVPKGTVENGLPHQ
jgi:hypothetical protein